MCYSATASFVSAALLATTGSAAFSYSHSRPHQMFASIPFFFSAQQACEGIVWMALGQNATTPIAHPAATAFLFFATAFWPLWIPLSLMRLESIPVRRQILRVLTALGGLVFIYASAVLLLHSPRVFANHHSLEYDITNRLGVIPPNLQALLYLLTAVIPFFVSSERRVKLMGALITGSLLLAIWIREETVTSVWCFFASLISLWITGLVVWDAKALKLRIHQAQS